MQKARRSGPPAKIGCDQNVTVEAENQEDAIEAAKAGAADIVVACIDEATLWVDEDIDITLSDPEAGAEAPAL